MKTTTIFFTSDIHGYVFPTDYTSDMVKHQGLLAINDSITRTDNTLLIDGGDTIQGSPFTTYLHDESKSPDIMADVMNTLGYDYVTLGNHDFNYGYDYLTGYLDRLDATVLCANVSDDSDQSGLIKDFAIHTMPNGMKLGLIGITTDYINIWEQEAHLTNFTISDPYSAAQAAINSLRSDVDVIVGIYHGGFEKDIHSHKQVSATSENIAFKLCETLDFDLLLTGHQHIPMVNHLVHGTHIVQTPMNGLQFAKITLEYDLNLTTKAKTDQLRIQSELIIPEVTSCLKESYNKWTPIEANVQTWLDQYIGALDTKMIPGPHIDMAISGNPIANFLNQVQLDATGADISCTSLANAVLGMDTKVTLRDIVATYKYPNTQVVLEVTGTILRKALEQSAGYFDNNHGHLSVSEHFMKPKVAHYNYDYFSGIHYIINTKNSVGQRIESLTYKGCPVQDDQIFTLAMNNYRASGTGDYSFYTHCPVILDLQTSTTDMVIAYIQKHPQVIVDQTPYYKVIGIAD